MRVCLYSVQSLAVCVSAPFGCDCQRYWHGRQEANAGPTWHMAILLVDANPWKKAILINPEENSVMEDFAEHSNEQPLAKRG